MTCPLPTTPAALADHEFLVPGLPYSAPELWAMNRSGLVIHLAGDLYLPASHPGALRVSSGLDHEAVGLRAAVLHRLATPVVSGHWAAMGLSAAWALVGGPTPTTLEVAVDRYHRVPLHPLSVRWCPEQTDLFQQPEDLLDLRGLPCTAPDRTVEDLLRRVDQPTQAAAARLAAARLLPLLPAEPLRERFERNRRRPGMAAARRALEDLLA